MRPKTYRVNDNYFKKWSHNMAYILGLWFSDGCITSKSVFAITLHERDRKLLQDVLAEMASNHVVTKNRRCSVIRINSADIYNDIIKLGGKERKSLDCRFSLLSCLILGRTCCPAKNLPIFLGLSASFTY